MTRRKRLVGLAVMLFAASLLGGLVPVAAANPGGPNATTTISMRIATPGSVDTASGVATIQGTVTCSQPAAVFLQGDLTQVTDEDEPTYVHFSHFLALCSGVTRWSITTDYAAQSFVAGWIVVNAEAEVDDWETGVYVFAEASANVRLRETR